MSPLPKGERGHVILHDTVYHFFDFVLAPFAAGNSKSNVSPLFVTAARSGLFAELYSGGEIVTPPVLVNVVFETSS